MNRAYRTILALVAFAAAGPASAQVGPVVDPQQYLSSRADERFELATLREWYDDIGARLDASRNAAAADALARAASVARSTRDFEAMRSRDADALVAAHTELVESLDLPASERIECTREKRVGSRVPVVACRLAVDALAASERDRAAVRRIQSATGSSD